MVNAIGFIGLGNMGLPMLENLVNARDERIYALDCADRPFEQLSRNSAWGTRLFRAQRIEDLGECALVITILPNSQITNAVLSGSEGTTGLIDILRPGSLIVDMGSSSSGETQAQGRKLAAKGITLIDAPVSGAVAKARTGKLAIMVGGDASAREQAAPYLNCMGETVIPTGRLGSAHAIKSLNNYVYAAGLLAVSEALAMAERLELDLNVVTDIINASSGRNVASETKVKQFIIPRTFSGGFALSLMAKDLRTAAELQGACNFEAPQLALCERIWNEACAMLPAEADNTEIYRIVNQESLAVEAQ